jgi:hypothetical protein
MAEIGCISETLSPTQQLQLARTIIGKRAGRYVPLMGRTTLKRTE